MVMTKGIHMDRGNENNDDDAPTFLVLAVVVASSDL